MITDFEFLMDFKERGNGLILSTHCSRVDWLLGVFMGLIGRKQSRIGFVAEVTTAFMPIIGWSRALFGDIMLRRAFHRDRPRIIENIEGFSKSGIDRIIFVAPEGTVADPGRAPDEKYIRDCKQFMVNLGRQPMTHLLTPRYKGMSALVHHSPSNVASSSMAFVTGDYQVDEDGCVTGDYTLCSRALSDPRRSIPDLHDVFRGGLTAFVEIHPIELYHEHGQEELDEVGRTKIRDQLINDQVFKDNQLRTFEKDRKYTSISAREDWTCFPTPHFRMNAILIGQTLFTVFFWSYALNYTVKEICYFALGMWLAVSLIHGSTHALGQYYGGGFSRESLVGETAIKALFSLITGRDANQGGKPEQPPPVSSGAKESKSKDA